MNRNSDIRKLMNLMESAPAVTLTEDDTSVLVDFTDKVLDKIKADMDSDPEHATGIVDFSLDDLIYAFIEKESDDFYDKLVANGWPKPAKEFKYLNDKFKEKFGLGFFKYADKLENAAYDTDKKSIKAEDKIIYKTIGDKLTISATPKWAAENLRFYVMSAKKVVIEDDGHSFPSAVIGAPSLEKFKMNQKEFIDWLLAHGIKQKKRPVQKKSPPSMYD